MNYIRDFEDGTAKTSLGKIYYKIHRGTDKMVVMLHGMGATSRVWSRMLEYIPAEVGICLVDLLGHGNSDAPEIDYTVEVQAKVVEELIGALNLGSCYLVGHSYGGWIAGYYASKNSVAGLILIDSAGLKEQFEPMIEGGGMDEYMDMLLQAAMYMNENKSYVIKSILKNTLNFQLDAAMLAKIDVPTLIIWGAEDGLIPLYYGGVFNSRIKKSSILVIKGGGHEPHYTYAEEVGKAITRFLLPGR